MIETEDHGERVTWTGAILNLALGIAKVGVGFLAGSRALVADGAHSLSDLVSDVVVLLSLRLSRAAPDAEHPYGHGRIETIGSAALGLILIGAGIGVLWDAIRLLIRGAASRPGLEALVVAAASIAVKEFLYQLTVRVGRRQRSDLLVANAWHHRSDALSSVAAFVGIGAAMLGMAWADPVAAMIVAVLIGWVGIGVIRRAAVDLIDTAAPAEVRESLQRTILGIPGVRDLHDLMTRRSGRGFHVEVDIEVDADQTVAEGHDIADAVRVRVLETFEDAIDVVVHVDPWTPG
jgi:cation diffusion facilitator family transporter